MLSNRRGPTEQQREPTLLMLGPLSELRETAQEASSAAPDAFDVPAVGLDAIAPTARDQFRGARQTLDPDHSQLASQPGPSRSGLIGRAHRPRLLSRERGFVVSAAWQPLHPQLRRVTLQRGSHHAADVHIESRPGPSLRHVSPHDYGPCRASILDGQPAHSHPRLPTLTPEPDRPAAKDDGPHGSAVRERSCCI